MNHFQRVYFLSRQTHLTVFARKDADFSSSAAEGTEIIRAPCNGKLGVFLACFVWMICRGRAEHYDVILTEPSKLCICGWLGKAILGAKWVVDVWDIPFRCGSKSIRPWRRCASRVDRTMARFLFKGADYFLLSILPEMEFAEFGIPPTKMLLLKNAIWRDESPAPGAARRESVSARFTILCMRSRFSYDSGLDLLSDAFEQLCRAGGDRELTIVGTIPDAVEPQVSRLRGRPNVHFRPFVEHEELLQMMAACSACVIPYRKTSDLSQIFPIKVLEYLSQGAVVVAPDLPGIAALITHGHNGLLFEPGNAGDLAEKLRAVQRDPPDAARISARAAALGEEFNCRRKAQVILGALERLCAREKPWAAGAWKEA